MGAVPLKEGMSAEEFRAAAAAAKDANQARRLLALAGIRDGMSRKAAARIGGMDRQTLRDWVHAFNAHGIDGLIDDTSPGRPCKLTDKQKAEIEALVDEGPRCPQRWHRALAMHGSRSHRQGTLRRYCERGYNGAHPAPAGLLPHQCSPATSQTEGRRDREL